MDRKAFFDLYLSKHPLKIDGRLFRYACPCCGYPALTGKGGLERCHICHWEDDGQDDDTWIDSPSSSNRGLTLRQARDNFRRNVHSSSAGKAIMRLRRIYDGLQGLPLRQAQNLVKKTF